MADWSTPLASLMTTGSVAFMLTIAKAARDESEHWAERRRRRKAERREDEQEPLKAEQLHLGVVDQATVIQQRMIETQRQQIQELDLRNELQRAEYDQKIAALERQNAAQEQKIREQEGEMVRLARRMAQMELELERYRTGGAV